MTSLKERVAYLQGLTQGLNVNSQSSEGKLLLNIIEVLDDVAEEIQTVQVMQQDLENYVETIDEDLTDLEDEVYDERTQEEEVVEVKCPSCHETVTFESDVLEEDTEVEVTCPYCGETVYDNTFNIKGQPSEAEINELDFRRGIHPGV